MYLRPDGTPRSPFAFCSFFGGKRICLGKTLAEFMTTFTLPLIMYYLDFEFVDPEHAKTKPNFQLGTFTAPEIQMVVKPLRKID
jgi:cytochrome P450